MGFGRARAFVRSGRRSPIASLCWPRRIAVGFLRRRSSVNYRNLTRWRRRQLARWLILDLSLAGGPPLLWFRGVWF